MFRMQRPDILNHPGRVLLSRDGGGSAEGRGGAKGMKSQFNSDESGARFFAVLLAAVRTSFSLPPPGSSSPPSVLREELNIPGPSARGHARDLGYKTRPRTTKTGDVGGLLIFYRSPVALPFPFPRPSPRPIGILVLPRPEDLAKVPRPLLRRVLHRSFREPCKTATTVYILPRREIICYFSEAKNKYNFS